MKLKRFLLNVLVFTTGSVTIQWILFDEIDHSIVTSAVLAAMLFQAIVRTRPTLPPPLPTTNNPSDKPSTPSPKV